MTARGIDCCLYVTSCGVDVSVEIKLQNDSGRADLARRSHLIHARNTPELPLQRRCHCGCHRFRTGSRKRGRYADNRKLHLRQRCHRKKLKRENTSQQHANRQ